MKKVICNIEEDYNRYIILFYLIKIKGKSFHIVDRLPMSINKSSILNVKEFKDFTIMINKTLHKYKFNKSKCIITLNSFKIIRDEFIYPKISMSELKKVITIEVNKRYSNDGIIYNKITKEDNKLRNNVIIINSSIKNMVDNLFNNINLKIKKILFLPETINNYIKDMIDEPNYFFLYIAKDYYLMNVVINKNIIYTSKLIKPQKLITKILSIYGYYSHELNNKIYISKSNDEDMEQIKSIDLKKIDICSNKLLEVESVITKYVTNEYEKI